MKRLSRRDFVKSSLLTSGAIPLGATSQAAAQNAAPAGTRPVAAGEAMPMGQIAGQSFSRLFMGGNLIAGWSHSRDLGYVSTLMRRYNTPAKIRETLELGESQGITAINSYVMDDNTQIFEHWKAGGKIKSLQNPGRRRAPTAGRIPVCLQQRRGFHPGGHVRLASRR